MSHFFAMVLISLVVSVVFAFTSRNSPRDRVIYGLKMFAGLIGFAILAGWLLYFLPW